ncbi:MAG: dephospho-CoA kinase, long form [Cryobacterium sp.]|nr:dephospho-CoA kinase, long form [Cryobacterium sp.]MBX3090563.1 dephospho-CoA kinase, long form [Cryobacterium sp.]MCO5293954.1 dephospho-CoA kinase [Homoserinimonas sp.]
MYLIGLTGGIASGKSVVSARLRELGAVIVDADAIAREVVEPGQPALGRIVKEFGPEILAEDGRLDRARLGAMIFADPALRSRLDQITHPEVKRIAQQRIHETARENESAIVVYDVPLLVEAGVDSEHPFDLIVVVDATPEIRIERLVEIRGMSREEAKRRILSQAEDSDRLAIADVVIDANGEIQDTLDQVDALWEIVSGLTRT